MGFDLQPVRESAEIFHLVINNNLNCKLSINFCDELKLSYSKYLDQKCCFSAQYIRTPCLCKSRQIKVKKGQLVELMTKEIWSLLSKGLSVLPLKVYDNDLYGGEKNGVGDCSIPCSLQFMSTIVPVG